MRTITYSYSDPRRVAEFLADHGITEETVPEGELNQAVETLHAFLTQSDSDAHVPSIIVLNTRVTGFSGWDEAALAMDHLGGYREPVRAPRGVAACVRWLRRWRG